MGAKNQFTWNGRKYYSYTEFCKEAGFTTASDKAKFSRLMSLYNRDVDKVLRHMYNEEIAEDTKTDLEFDKLLDNFDKICVAHNIKYRDIFYNMVALYKNEKDALREYRKEARIADDLKEAYKRSITVEEVEHSYKRSKEVSREEFFEKVRADKEERLRKLAEEENRRKKLEEAKRKFTPTQESERIQEEISRKVHSKQRMDVLTPKQKHYDSQLGEYYSVILSDICTEVLNKRNIDILVDGMGPKVKIRDLIINCVGMDLYIKIVQHMTRVRGDSVGEKLGMAFYKLDIYDSRTMDIGIATYNEIALYVLYLMKYNYLHKKEIYRVVWG